MSQPKGERERRTVRLSAELGERLKERAEQEGKAENDIILFALEVYLNGPAQPDTKLDINLTPLSIQPDTKFANPHSETLQPDTKLEYDSIQVSDKVAPTQDDPDLMDRLQDKLNQKRRQVAPAPKRLSSLLYALPDAPAPTPLPAQAPAPLPLPPCEHCDNVRAVMTGEGSYVTAEPCPVCALDCLSCGGRGHFLIDEGGYEKLVPCACEDRTRRRRIFNATKIPSLYRARLFGSSKSPSGYKASMAQHAAHERLAAWLKNYEPGCRGVLLYGPIGTAKTTLLCRLLARLSLQRGVSSRFVEWSLLIEQTKETFGEDEPNPLLPLQHVPVVVVDELGKRATSSEWQQEQLDNLLSARYQHKHTTLYSTNLHPTETRNGVQSLRDRIGHRLFDRLVERCEFIEVAGSSMRPVLARGMSQDA